MTKYFQVKQVKPNPFRRIDKYPMRPEKISALTESIDQTSFWENIVGRELADGTCEIAYGHHRLRVLQMKFKPTDKVGIIIRDLSDTDMLKIMGRENMEEWGSSALVEVETIAAVVQAYAQNRIKLDPPDKRAMSIDIRSAPGYTSGLDSSRDHPYTAVSVGRFLGWLTPRGVPQDKVHTALNALELMDLGELKESDLAGLKTTELREIIEETNRRRRLAEFQAKQAEEAAARNEKSAKLEQNVEDRERHKALAQRFRTEAKQHRETGRKESGKVARVLTEKVRSGAIGRKQIRGEAFNISPLPNKKIPPDINQAARKLSHQVSGILDRDDPLNEKLNELIDYREHIDRITKLGLVTELKRLGSRSNKLAERLEQEAKLSKPLLK